MADAAIKKFKGLNNVSDNLRLSDGWMTIADNVDVTDTGAVARRDGFSLALSAAPTGAYTTKDFTRMYVVDGGTLKKVNADMSTTNLRAGITAAPMYWTEINQQVFFTNGVSSGVILVNDTVVDWSLPSPATPNVSLVGGTLPAGTYQVLCTFMSPDGRESGASYSAEIAVGEGQSIRITDIPRGAGQTLVYIAPADSTVFQLAFATTNATELWNSPPEALGRELLNQFLDPLPINAILPTVWKGQIYLAEFLPSENISIIWSSEPLGFHLFNSNDGFFMVPGKCLMLCPTDKTLVVGTDVQIHSYDGTGIKLEAQYGVVPGWQYAADELDEKWFWSTRGVCSALPFSNITLNQISVQSGLNAGAAIVQKNGVKQFVVALHKGGVAFNQRT